MSFENLVRIGQLHVQTPDRDAVQRQLGAADRSLRDAAHHELEPESRFDLAYKAVSRASIAALLANGYRTSTSVPGHHQTAIQALQLSIGYSSARIQVLDGLRRKRNAVDYEADLVSEAMVQSCIGEATRLVAAVRDWLNTAKPELRKALPITISRWTCS